MATVINKTGVGSINQTGTVNSSTAPSTGGANAVPAPAPSNGTATAPPQTFGGFGTQAEQDTNASADTQIQQFIQSTPGLGALDAAAGGAFSSWLVGQVGTLAGQGNTDPWTTIQNLITNTMGLTQGSVDLTSPQWNWAIKADPTTGATLSQDQILQKLTAMPAYQQTANAKNTAHTVINGMASMFGTGGV